MLDLEIIRQLRADMYPWEQEGERLIIGKSNGWWTISDFRGYLAKTRDFTIIQLLVEAESKELGLVRELLTGESHEEIEKQIAAHRERLRKEEIAKASKGSRIIKPSRAALLNLDLDL